MAIRTVKIAFSNKNTITIPTYNSTGLYDPINVGQVIPNLKDSDGIDANLSLHVEASCHGTTGAAANADEDIWEVPADVWRFLWRLTSSTKTGKLRISGFNPGQNILLKTAAHTNSVLTTNFSFNNLPTIYPYIGKVKPPAEPLSGISLTANSSGDIYIDAARVGLYGSINFLHLTYDPVVAVSISSIENFIYSQICTINISSTSYNATSIKIDDTLVSKNTNVAGSNGIFQASVPIWIAGSTGIKFGSVVVTITDGATPSLGFAASLLPPVNYLYTDLTSVVPENYGQAALFDPPLKINTQCLYNSSHLKVNPDGTITSPEPATGYVGVTQVWDRDPDTGITRIAVVTITESGGGNPPVFTVKKWLNGEPVFNFLPKGEKITAERL